MNCETANTCTRINNITFVDFVDGEIGVRVSTYTRPAACATVKAFSPAVAAQPHNFVDGADPFAVLLANARTA